MGVENQSFKKGDSVRVIDRKDEYHGQEAEVIQVYVSGQVLYALKFKDGTEVSWYVVSQLELVVGTQSLNWEQPRRYGSVLKYANVKIEQFTCKIEVVEDHDHDWAIFRGKFTDAWEEGAIDYPPAQYNNRVFKYFVPFSTEKEHIKGLLDTGMSLEEAQSKAHEYVMEDMEIAAEPGSKGYIAVGVTVTVSFKGVELADASVWGIEIDNSDVPYIDEVAQEELQEALIEAREKLEELRQA